MPLSCLLRAAGNTRTSWLAAIALQSLPPSSHSPSLRLSLGLLSLIRTLVGFRAHPKRMIASQDPSFLLLQRPLFQIRPHSWVQEHEPSLEQGAPTHLSHTGQNTSHDRRAGRDEVWHAPGPQAGETGLSELRDRPLGLRPCGGGS